MFKINKELELGVIYFNRVKLKVTDTIIPVTLCRPCWIGDKNFNRTQKGFIILMWFLSIEILGIITMYGVFRSETMEVKCWSYHILLISYIKFTGYHNNWQINYLHHSLVRIIFIFCHLLGQLQILSLSFSSVLSRL